MSTPFVLRVDDLELPGQLGDGPVARELAAALPVAGAGAAWGDAFQVPVAESVVSEEAATRDRASPGVERGDLAFWPERRTLWIFFGPTPLSPEEDPVAPARLVPVGRVDGSEHLREVRDAEEIELLPGGEDG